MAESKIPAFKNGRALTARRRGRPPLDFEIILEAFFYRLRVSGAWRDLPPSFSPWRSIYGWYQAFDQKGIWSDILRMVAKGAKGKARYIDGTHIRVHQAGANPAGGAQAQAMGKTKGGRNSKLKLMVDLQGRPIAMLLVPGQDY